MFAIGDQDLPGLSKLTEECGELLAALATPGGEGVLDELGDAGAALGFVHNVVLCSSEQQEMNARVPAAVIAVGNHRSVWQALTKACGLLLQVIGKLMATHGRREHWDGTDLRRRLIERMADLGAAISVVRARLPPADARALDERFDQKLKLFESWHTAQVTAP